MEKVTNAKQEELLKMKLLSYINQENYEAGNMASEVMVPYSLNSDRFRMVNLIRQGLPYSIFSIVYDLSPLSDNDWIRLLDLSLKTMVRYKQSQKKFRPIHSEKILEVAELTLLGLDVFGNTGQFSKWLHHPNFALGGIKPIILVHDSYGKELLMAELINIKHGIFA